MYKDKLVLLKKNEIAVLKGLNSNDFIVTEISNNNLNFSIYSKSSAEAVEYKLAVAINNKNVYTYEFEEEVYLRAKSDTEAYAPFFIEEDEGSLNLVNLRETDCTSIVDDLIGNDKTVSKNFDILVGSSFLIEDEFSI